MLHYLRLMLQLAMSPTRGWEDIAEGSQSSRQTLLNGLLPLAAIAALTTYFGAFFQSHASFGSLTVAAVVTFIKYSVSYFVATAALLYAIPRMSVDGLVNREDVGIFVAYCLGIMAVIGTLEHLLPMEVTLLQFLPIYVVVVICMGRRFMDIEPQSTFRFAAVSSAAIILPVFLIDMLLLPAK